MLRGQCSEQDASPGEHPSERCGQTHEKTEGLPLASGRICKDIDYSQILTVWQNLADICAQAPPCSRKRCASSAAMQPVPALVMAWRYTWSCTSPAANTPGTLVMVAKPLLPLRVRM